MIDKEEIKKIIPYEEPFLFVHGVEEMTEDKITGFYQTSPDDYYFHGHFVDFKIMPGVLVVEALAQLATILLRKKTEKEHRQFHFLAYNLRGAQFLKPIFPGERIALEAELVGFYELPDSRKIANWKSRARVGPEVRLEARFSVIVIRKEDFERKYVGRENNQTF